MRDAKKVEIRVEPHPQHPESRCVIVVREGDDEYERHCLCSVREMPRELASELWYYRIDFKKRGAAEQEHREKQAREEQERQEQSRDREMTRRADTDFGIYTAMLERAGVEYEVWRQERGGTSLRVVRVRTSSDPDKKLGYCEFESMHAFDRDTGELRLVGALES